MPKLAPKPVRFIKRQDLMDSGPPKAASLPPEQKPKPAIKKPSMAPPKPKQKFVRIQTPKGFSDSDRSVDTLMLLISDTCQSG